MNVDMGGLPVPVAMREGDPPMPLPDYPLDVRRFGAVGDGTTDDTTAIQAALDTAYQAGGGTVVIPGGAAYAVSSDSLRIRDNTRLVAHGARVLGNGTRRLLLNYLDSEYVPGGAPGYSGHGNIVVEGGIWDERGHQAAPGVMGAMMFAHARGITVRDLTIRNVNGGHACEPHAVHHMLVDNVRFEGYRIGTSTFYREAVQIDAVGAGFDDDTACDGVTVRNCYFGASPVPGECGPWGRSVGGHSVGTVPHKRIRVLGNDIDSPASAAIRPYSWSDSIVAGNTIRGGQAEGIRADVAAGVPATRLVIAHNVISGKRSRGIWVASADKGVSDYTDVLVDGNIIDGAATPVGSSHVTAPRLGTNIT